MLLQTLSVHTQSTRPVCSLCLHVTQRLIILLNKTRQFLIKNLQIEKKLRKNLTWGQHPRLYDVFSIGRHETRIFLLGASDKDEMYHLFKIRRSVQMQTERGWSNRCHSSRRRQRWRGKIRGVNFLRKGSGCFLTSEISYEDCLQCFYRAISQMKLIFYRKWPG